MKIMRWLGAIILLLFGLLTLFLSSSVIFDWFGIRAKEGNYVPLVVWANFIASILYIAASMAWIQKNKIATWFLGISSFLLILAIIGFYIHIGQGGLYEIKTSNGLIFRTGFTLLFTFFSYINLKKIKK